MQACKPIGTPITKRINLSKSNCLGKRQHKLNVSYAQAIGSLMYLMLYIRLDINFPIELMHRY